MTDLIDFMVQPDESDFSRLDRNYLRRSDLATLRQIGRAMPLGVETGDLISKEARDRLLRSELIVANVQGHTRYIVTPIGAQTIRYNMSCIDGSEGYDRKRFRDA